MALDTEDKRWSMLAHAAGPPRALVFNPNTSGLVSIEKITVLQHYGGISWISDIIITGTDTDLALESDTGTIEASAAQTGTGVSGGGRLVAPDRPLRRLRRIEEEIRARAKAEAQEPELPDVGNVVSLDRMRRLKGDADVSGLPTLQELSVERIGEIISEPGGLETVMAAILEQQQKFQSQQEALKAQQKALETMHGQIQALQDDLDALTGFAMLGAAEDNGVIVVTGKSQ